MNLKKNELQDFVESGLKFLGSMVADKLGCSDYNPTGNSGSSFSNDTFELHSYCWCDNTMKEHKDGCPNNFIIKKYDFSVNWYKYLGRGTSQNRVLTNDEWNQIMVECLESLK